MSKLALNYLKDLQRQIIDLKEDAENKLEMVDPENFRDDVTDNVIERISDLLYEIETIISDTNDGYYDGRTFDDDDNDDLEEEF
mgnify:FL=1|jgi:hypothetical protein